MDDNINIKCKCGLDARKYQCKKGKNIGRWFFKCSKNMNNDPCKFFEWEDPEVNYEESRHKDPENREPDDRYIVSTDDAINKKSKFYITPLTNKRVIQEFIDKWSPKRHILGKTFKSPYISPLSNRELIHINVYIPYKDRIITGRVIPLRKKWMNFDYKYPNLPKIKDDRMKDIIMKMYMDSLRSNTTENVFDDDDKLWVCYHDIGKYDKGFLYGYAKWIIFEVSDSSFIIVSRKKLLDLKNDSNREVKIHNSVYSYFLKNELSDIIKFTI